MTWVDPSAFADMCREELLLCKVAPGDNVAIVRSGAARAHYAVAFMEAARAIGASVVEVNLPAVSNGMAGRTVLLGAGQPLSGNRMAVEALKQADLVVDLMFVLYTHEVHDLKAAGARILSCVEPVSVLARLFPTEELRRECERSAQVLAAAKEMRITNKAGMDVTYALGDYPVLTQYGYTDEPGRWDHWPSGGFLYTSGADDGVNGRVVVDEGDIVFPFGTYVRTPVEFSFEAGRVTGISGGIDAELVKEYMHSFGDDRAYSASHIGWGLDRRARWSSQATHPGGIGMEARGFYGSVLFSTGPNLEVGGTNDTPCHLDIPMRNCSVFLDGEPVVVDGEVVIGR